MESIFIVFVGVLLILAIADLVVGVSNDAVNFLNSAIGSKVAPLKTIMIIASLGILLGVTFSSGMMEVARKGIFNPEYFYFSEIMTIFLAVMIADIVLLDFFNTFGFPTSTTVSIVFELLGAAVIVSFIKIIEHNQGLAELSNYLNTSKAFMIIMGILLSVVFAFVLGWFLQYLSRLIFSFHTKKRMKYVGSTWAGFAFTALLYFLMIKGLKGSSFATSDQLQWVKEHTYAVLIISFIVCTIITQVLVSLKVNILKIVVLFGTFTLAMAFASNDLVNFVGVPIAGLESFKVWSASGIEADQFSMEALSDQVRTPTLLLLLAGLIMVLSLWFSTKAKTVTQTEIRLARQEEGLERFRPNLLAKGIVRFARNVNKVYKLIAPPKWRDTINASFDHHPPDQKKGKGETSAFDLVRASVNLTMASILIAFATSLKLPLSTTYVTFMVAMGTSLADRAWGRDSAVFRVSGVLHVIGGWFLTAIFAFGLAGIFAFFIHKYQVWAVGVLLMLAVLFIIHGYRYHKQKKQKEEIKNRLIEKTLGKTASQILEETKQSISNVLISIYVAFDDAINGLIREDLDLLKNSKSDVKRIEENTFDLKSNLVRSIKNIKENDTRASRLFVLFIDLQQEILQSIQHIVKSCHDHVDNEHSPLMPGQVKELKKLNEKVIKFLGLVIEVLKGSDIDSYKEVSRKKSDLLNSIESKLILQIQGVKSNKYSTRNTMLYFSILLETKNLITTGSRFVKLYKKINSTKKGKLITT